MRKKVLQETADLMTHMLIEAMQSEQGLRSGRPRGKTGKYAKQGFMVCRIYSTLCCLIGNTTHPASEGKWFLQELLGEYIWTYATLIPGKVLELIMDPRCKNILNP